MCTRMARHLGVETVIGIDLVPDRLERARKNDVETIDLRQHGKDLADVVRGLSGGRGPDAVIDAVGLEAHGSPVGKAAQQITGLLPDAVASRLMQTAGVDRLGAVYSAVEIVRRGGTISLSGVYGGMADPMPMLQIFDKQLQLRMGQANVHRWVPDILPLLTDADPLGVDDFATHRLPLGAGPEAYSTFQKKQDGMVKTLLQPRLG
jgi:threonine dehydrogenase-like Zn-dependent dehydrogenase